MYIYIYIYTVDSRIYEVDTGQYGWGLPQWFYAAQVILTPNVQFLRDAYHLKVGMLLPMPE